MVMYLEGHMRILTVLAAGDGLHAAKSVDSEDLPDVEQQLIKIQVKIKDHCKTYFKVKNQWSKLKDHVIRYVIWPPPISTNTAPYSYTQDICVIKLDKNNLKLCHFGGNVLSLVCMLTHLTEGVLSNCSYFRARDLPQ